jgi:uncharacterized protein
MVVVDTNVWLSAWLAAHGVAAQALRRALNHGVIAFSPATFAELESRVWRPKFDRYFSPTQRHRLLRDARALAHWVSPDAEAAQLVACRDPDDDAFLQVAWAAQAQWLLTGDADLLVLQAVGGTPIVSPAEFLLATAAPAQTTPRTPPG